MGGELIAPDVIAEAAELPFRDGSLDFVIASHVLEHHLAGRGTEMISEVKV